MRASVVGMMGGLVRAPESAAIFYDPADLTTLRQGFGGSGALVGVGDFVGSMLNKGTVGGWASAPNDAARPVLQREGDSYFILSSAPDKFLDLTTAQSAQFTGQHYVMTYGAEFEATGTLLGGQGTDVSENLHTGLDGGRKIGFGLFGNNLLTPLAASSGEPLVVAAAQTTSGRYIRERGVLKASDTNTALLANGGLRLFLGPLGRSSGEDVRMYGLIQRPGSAIPDPTRNSDEQFIAFRSGISFLST